MEFVLKTPLPVFTLATLLAPFISLLNTKESKKKYIIVNRPEMLAEFSRISIIKDNWIDVDTWVIDDLNLISAAEWALTNTLAKFLRQNSKPFGGLQIMAFGDFAHYNSSSSSFFSSDSQTQIGKEFNMDMDISSDLQKMPFRQLSLIVQTEIGPCFESFAFSECFQRNIIGFKNNIRTKTIFADVVSLVCQDSDRSRVRISKIIDSHQEYIKNNPSQVAVIATSSTKGADIINSERNSALRKLKEPTQTWESHSQIEVISLQQNNNNNNNTNDCILQTNKVQILEAFMNSLQQTSALRYHLVLGKGVQVMLTHSQNGHAPGEIGTVIGFTTKEIIPTSFSPSFSPSSLPSDLSKTPLTYSPAISGIRTDIANTKATMYYPIVEFKTGISKIVPHRSKIDIKISQPCKSSQQIESDSHPKWQYPSPSTLQSAIFEDTSKEKQLQQYEQKKQHIYELDVPQLYGSVELIQLPLIVAWACPISFLLGLHVPGISVNINCGSTINDNPDNSLKTLEPSALYSAITRVSNIQEFTITGFDMKQGKMLFNTCATRFAAHVAGISSKEPDSEQSDDDYYRN